MHEFNIQKYPQFTVVSAAYQSFSLQYPWRILHYKPTKVFRHREYLWIGGELLSHDAVLGGTHPLNGWFSQLAEVEESDG